MADLYDIVGDKIIEFCDKTYYGEIVCSFEQSYDGVEWTKETEFAYFENCTELWFENDWNEGQTYIRNLRIWHLEDSEPIKHGRWKHHQCGNNAGYYECDNCGKINSYKSNYCPLCGAKMDAPAPEAVEILNDGTYSAGEEDHDG